MDGIAVVVRADDFGVCHAANQAIVEAFETGLLTCASLAVAAPWSAEATALVLAHPEWEVGLQLGLTCPTSGCRWGPVAGPAAHSTLVGPTGWFGTNLSAHASPDDIDRELHAQLERAIALNLRPAYLEYVGESNVAVEQSVQRVSEEQGLPCQMTAWGLKPLLPALEAPSYPQAVVETLSRLAPGTYLWLTRPAQDSPETWALWSDDLTAPARHADWQALCSPELALAFRRHGIERISFRQYVEIRLGAAADD